MPNADLARREKPCPTCGGSGEITKYRMRFPKSLPSDAYQDTCPTCHGFRTVPAESDPEYAARLRSLVEQARKERDWLAARAWTTCVKVKHEYIGGYSCPWNCANKVGDAACVAEQVRRAARAVAGKDGADANEAH